MKERIQWSWEEKKSHLHDQLMPNAALNEAFSVSCARDALEELWCLHLMTWTYCSIEIFQPAAWVKRDSWVFLISEKLKSWCIYNSQEAVMFWWTIHLAWKLIENNVTDFNRHFSILRWWNASQRDYVNTQHHCQQKPTEVGDSAWWWCSSRCKDKNWAHVWHVVFQWTRIVKWWPLTRITSWTY